MSGMAARCERTVAEIQLWYGYVCMLACVCGAYLIVGNKLSLGSFDTEIYIGVYMEVFSLPFSYIQRRAQITLLYI